MKNVFVDANIIIDFLATREPFSADAAALFELAEKNKLKIFISAVSFNVVYYVLRQKYGHKTTIDYLTELCSLAIISDVTQTIINNALASDNPDFEDSIQYYTALSAPKIDAIVSRDKKGFKKSAIPVFTAHETVLLVL